MANSNNICTRFINYFAVLILVFLSSSVNASSFGGGGASGSWDEQCSVTEYKHSLATRYFNSPSSACADAVSVFNSMNSTHYAKLSLESDEVGYYCIGSIHQKSDDVLSQSYIRRLTTRPCSQICPDGYESLNGKCQPKKCPVGETLVNGQCQKKQCPAGQALDTNGNCMPRDDQCPAGQIMVNGRCTIDPNKDDDPPPEGSELPPFCEWASVMCQWHKEWQQWSNDYAANEQKSKFRSRRIKAFIFGFQGTINRNQFKAGSY